MKLTNNKLLLKPKLDDENIAGIIKKIEKCRRRIKATEKIPQAQKKR